jgi:hypothetical protein
MPGFLGGSSSGSGTGGEIRFPAELIDPVTKLRVSQPQTMMDTDFEYGLQPTKWETVELINNTPSFFSASGDTTIPNLLDVTTTAGSREVKVTASLPHGLAVGIPINVTGSKSLTADGAYIINSVPDSTTFTYLCKQNQLTTASIVDLYTSIITGQFFQGSQIKIADSEGIITNAAGVSTLTVKTDSPHGFGVNTPFYFLNLNSTVSQEFDSSNTGAKSFDSSNTATAQSFDGSNTLTSYAIDLDNKATISGTASSIVSTNISSDTVTVTHTAESFAGRPIGTPLYHSVSAAAGYFSTTPRGIVYLASNDLLGASSSEFKVSLTPGGAVLDLTVTLTGTFQLANNAINFAGNNTDTADQKLITILENSPKTFDGTNTAGSVSSNITVSNGSAIIQMTNTAGSGTSAGLYVGSMVRFNVSSGGTAPGGLANDTTYWVTFIQTIVDVAPGLVQIKLAALPGGADIVISSQGTGTSTATIRQIGVSIDKNIFHIPLHNFTTGDMVKYAFPSGGAVTMTNRTSDYVYVGTVYDTNNVDFNLDTGLQATGGTITELNGFKYHAFTTVGTSTFTVTGGEGTAEILVVAGGGGGGGSYGGGGGGGAGGLVYHSAKALTSGAYTVTVGDGGIGGIFGEEYTGDSARNGYRGENSVFGDITALGGGGGNMSFYFPSNRISGGSGGGAGDYYFGVNNPGASRGGAATQGNSGGGLGFGNPGGSRGPGGPTTAEDNTHASPHEGSGGGGAGGVPTGGSTGIASHGGIGKEYSQFASWGSPAGWFAGGGGGGYYNERSETKTNPPGTGGAFGGGGRGSRSWNLDFATNGVANTGGGGGGGSSNGNGNSTNGSAPNVPAGKGGSGIVIVRYKI